MIVYRILNTLTGKSYVGQTRQTLQRRWAQHQRHKSNSRGLVGAIQKYGPEAFQVSVLAEAACTEELDALERQYIKEFNCLVPDGYNLTTGGEGGYQRSPETRALLSAASRGKGRKHTPESRAKMSAQRTGAGNPAFGRKQAASTLQKRSEALKGRARPQWVKEKIRAGHLARKTA